MTGGEHPSTPCRALGAPETFLWMTRPVMTHHSAPSAHQPLQHMSHLLAYGLRLDAPSLRRGAPGETSRCKTRLVPASRLAATTRLMPCTGHKTPLQRFIEAPSSPPSI